MVAAEGQSPGMPVDIHAVPTEIGHDAFMTCPRSFVRILRFAVLIATFTLHFLLFVIARIETSANMLAAKISPIFAI